MVSTPQIHGRGRIPQSDLSHKKKKHSIERGGAVTINVACGPGRRRPKRVEIRMTPRIVEVPVWRLGEQKLLTQGEIFQITCGHNRIQTRATGKWIQAGDREKGMN